MKLICRRIIKGIIALIVTVACLYTGQALWMNYAVDIPLDNRLSGIDGVEGVSWDKGSNVKDNVAVNVILGNTPNIKKTYEEITKTIGDTLKDGDYTLAIEDNRTPELEKTYYQMHYYIHKSLMDGDFPLLGQKVAEMAEAAGASARVYVDEANIYLQISKSGNNLYSITARNSDRIGGGI